MNLDYLYKTFLNLKNDNLAFIYQGDFRDDITAKIINLSEFNLTNVTELTKLKKKISLIMVECFQNIVRHGDSLAVNTNRTTNKSKIFISRNIGSTFYITSANLIENKNIKSLKEKLVTINSLNKEELKNLYLEILSNEELSKKGGAGLGLIDMARKSGEKLEYDFEKVNDKLSFFYLQSRIQNHEDPEALANVVEIPIQSAKEFHKSVISWNILMIYKGDFAQDSIMPVLRMIENNMANQLEELRVKKLVYIALVEILQNISKHSMQLKGIQEGIFLMGQKDRHYIISSGNLIDNSEVAPLREQLDRINLMTKEELDQMYRAILRDGKMTFKGGAGLGLIDIARESNGKLEYEFYPMDENLSFFALIVRV